MQHIIIKYSPLGCACLYRHRIKNRDEAHHVFLKWHIIAVSDHCRLLIRSLFVCCQTSDEVYDEIWWKPLLRSSFRSTWKLALFSSCEYVSIWEYVNVSQLTVWRLSCLFSAVRVNVYVPPAVIYCENAAAASQIDESARCVYPLACIVRKSRFGFDAPEWSLELISVRGEKHKASSSVVKAIPPSATHIFSCSFSLHYSFKYVPCLQKHLLWAVWLSLWIHDCWPCLSSGF